MHVFENLERRRKRTSQGVERGGPDDLKNEGVETEEGGTSSPVVANPSLNAGVTGGVSTRRTSFTPVSHWSFCHLPAKIQMAAVNLLHHSGY